MSQEELTAGLNAQSDAAGNGGVAAAPAAGTTEDGAVPARRRLSRLPGQNGKTEDDAPTKTFEAPHRREKETFLTHVAGVTLLSFWRTASWLLGHLPPGPSFRVGGWLAMIGYAAGPQRRRWLRANFGHVLGVPPSDKAAGRLARAAYRNYARYVMELMRLPWLEKGEVQVLLDDADFQRFLDIYRHANGTILVAGHIGNNEAAASGMATQGLKINVVGDDSSFRELYELFQRMRESYGIKMISWRNLRGVYGALRRKEALVLLVDWGYRADGIPVKMFDCWTTLPAGPALLAAKHGSTILPFSICRVGDGQFRIWADQPITVPSDSPADLARATQEVATALEDHIRSSPEQWYNFKPIWPATAAEAEALEARHAAAMAGEAGALSGKNGNGRAKSPAQS